MTSETTFSVRQFIRTNKNSSGKNDMIVRGISTTFASHCLREKASAKKKAEKGEAEHERAEEAEYERVQKSRLHFALGLSTDFIIGLKHITLKAKSNIKNDRRYKCGD